MTAIVTFVRGRLLRSWKTSLAGAGVLLVALFGGELAAEDQRQISEAATKALELASLVLLAWKEKEK